MQRFSLRILTSSKWSHWTYNWYVPGPCWPTNKGFVKPFYGTLRTLLQYKRGDLVSELTGAPLATPVPHPTTFSWTTPSPPPPSFFSLSPPPSIPSHQLIIQSKNNLYYGIPNLKKWSYSELRWRLAGCLLCQLGTTLPWVVRLHPGPLSSRMTVTASPWRSRVLSCQPRHGCNYWASSHHRVPKVEASQPEDGIYKDNNFVNQVPLSL